MMRLTMAVWWSLALVWLLTSHADAESGLAQPARQEIKGIGRTLEVAKQDALREAAAKMQAELLRQQLEHWRPTERDVQEYLLEGPGREGPVETINKELGPLKTWFIPLKIPPEDALRNMDRQAERREVSEARMSLTLRAAAALAAVLTIIIGCVQIDEWTRSRYTGWLRAAGAALIAGVAAGWWWVR
ncbi:MAG: hypothetical protein L0Y71_17905 [Gemmataceae bacterium]|nr:hypothetical protein [Gemmataceae bacterium]